MPHPMRILQNLAAPALAGLVSACAAAISPASLTQSPSECHYDMPDQSRIYAEVEVDDPPRLIHHPVPMPYPSEMFRLGRAGRVSVHYVIDSTGSIVAPSISIDSASDPAFVPAATEILARSRFAPGVRQRQPVAVCVKQDLNWVLS